MKQVKKQVIQHYTNSFYKKYGIDLKEYGDTLSKDEVLELLFLVVSGTEGRMYQGTFKNTEIGK